MPPLVASLWQVAMLHEDSDRWRPVLRASVCRGEPQWPLSSVLFLRVGLVKSPARVYFVLQLTEMPNCCSGGARHHQCFYVAVEHRESMGILRSAHALAFANDSQLARLFLSLLFTSLCQRCFRLMCTVSHPPSQHYYSTCSKWSRA